MTKRKYRDEGGSESNAKRSKKKGKQQIDEDPFFLGSSKKKGKQQIDEDPFFLGSIKKGKGKVLQDEHDDMLESLKAEEEEDAFFKKLKKRGVTSREVKILRDAEIKSSNDLMIFSQENYKIRGLTEARLYEICKTALKVDKVDGINLLLKETAYAKKQNFVVVRNVAGVTDMELKRNFKLFAGFRHVEKHTRKKYGFVYFQTEENAKSVLRMNGNYINDKMIRVEMGDNESWVRKHGCWVSNHEVQPRPLG